MRKTFLLFVPFAYHIKNQKAKLNKAFTVNVSHVTFFCVGFNLRWFFVCFHLPVNLPNSSNISSLPFDFGMLPTKRRRLGTLTFIFKHLPGLISKLSSCCGTKGREEKNKNHKKRKKQNPKHFLFLRWANFLFQE